MLDLFFHFLDAYETSKMLCEQYYLTSPEMEITEVNCESRTILPLLAFNTLFLLVLHVAQLDLRGSVFVGSCEAPLCVRLCIFSAGLVKTWYQKWTFLD